MTIGGDSNKYGKRITVIFLNPKTTKLSICTTFKTNSNNCFNSAISLSRKKFTNIQIRQNWDTTQNVYKYTISLDRIPKYTVTNLTPQAIRDVKLWASDPWNEVADATMRNLVFKNLPNGKILQI